MILAINYANERFKKAQHFNSKTALKWGADKVIEYGPQHLDEQFIENNKYLYSHSRGGGYYIWKPYIVKDALSKVNEGDYVFYSDSGSALVNKISLLISAMETENTDIMVFCLTHMEKHYTKRDAFILMDCDIPEITDSPQICSTYFIIKKTSHSCNLVEMWLKYMQDPRIVSNDNNVMGKENYEGYVETRHDQTILSLLCKKDGIKPFRDPSQYGLDKTSFSADVNKRSTFPQVFESHRNHKCSYEFQLEYHNPTYKHWKKVKQFIKSCLRKLKK